MALARLDGSKIPASIDGLPDEVLQQILYHLSPRDILFHVQRTSKRLNSQCGEPLLWRYHCKTEFRYWDPKHSIRRKFSGTIDVVDWKSLYIQRRIVDFRTTSILNSILETQTDRISKFEKIAQLGYDAKDTLLRHCRTDPEAEDGLARRYYANAVLDHIHRKKAIKIWHTILLSGDDYFENASISPRDDISLERALGAFDLFIIHDNKGDLTEISDMLDDIAILLRLECPDIEQLSTRRKALATVAFLRKNNLTGLAMEVGYRDLQNSYIGIALQDENHPSLPLISVAIFCAIGRRVGLDARLCGIPNHVHGMVIPPIGETLDGRKIKDEEPQASPMYLDPYRSEQEVPIHDIRIMLTQWGIKQEQMSEYMKDIPVSSVILRTSRNILATVHDFRATARTAQNVGHPTISLHPSLHANPFADLDSSFYSALWANFLFGNPLRIPHGTPQHQFIPIILERFERLFPMDASLIEKYILPLCNNQNHPANENLLSTLHVVRAADQTPKQIHLRQPTSQNVIYKVGQVFRHRRYGYTAAIIGWDMECHMNSDWMAQNNVDSLSRGRYQSFYHAFVDDTSIRYVAEENVEIIKPEAPSSLMSLAGKFFKRWDKENHVFVSNIKDEYPED